MTKKLEVIKKKLETFFLKRPEILAVYIYGSQAKGYARKASDLDLAIMLDPEKREQVFSQSKLDSYSYQSLLEELAQETVPEVPVSVILLENMNYPLRHNATLGGVLIYSKDNKKRIQEESKIDNTRDDFGDFFDIRLKYSFEAARRRLHEGISR